MHLFPCRLYQSESVDLLTSFSGQASHATFVALSVYINQGGLTYVYCVACLCRFNIFFLSVLWLGICVEVDVYRITTLPPPPFPIFFLTHNSFFNTSDS